MIRRPSVDALAKDPVGKPKPKDQENTCHLPRPAVDDAIAPTTPPVIEETLQKMGPAGSLRCIIAATGVA